MKNKPLTALLVAAIMFIPAKAPAPEKETIVAVCAIVAMGVLGTAAIWYACSKLPPPPGTCRCGCRSTSCGCPKSGPPEPEALNLLPPVGVILTNPAAVASGGRLDFEGNTPYGSGSMVDDQGRPWIYSAAFSIALETSVDLEHWSYALTLNGWLTTEGGALFAVRSNDVTLVNAYFESAINPANGLPLDLPGGPKRFYRVSCQ